MIEWKTYTPTFTRLGEKPIKLPNGKTNGYYRSGLHINTTAYEYRTVGKTVEMKASFKRLGLWDSLKFMVRTKLTKSEQNIW